MPFFYSESSPDGTRNPATDTQVNPGPSYPEYPQRLRYTFHETDGGGVRQRSKRGRGEYKWVWRNWGPANQTYEDMYWSLFNLQAHVRRANGDSPYVYLRDTSTKNLGPFNLGTGQTDADWVKCLVLFVGREEAQRGGSVVYDVTEMRFSIVDDSIVY